jgi:zinc/manganese transport system substrate-binding protein
MAKSLGIQMHGETFQISMMNDVPPTVSQIEQFTDDLQHHTVKILIYNNQVIDPLTQRMRSLAEKEGIPVVGVSEMLPRDVTYIEWMKNQLTNLENALEKSKRNRR